MTLRIPQELITWLDSNRGSFSRQGYIINTLFKLMKEEKIKALD